MYVSKMNDSARVRVCTSMCETGLSPEASAAHWGSHLKIGKETELGFGDA